ncbi:MAG: type VI secretion system tube protein Hcp [Cellvibrionaceae bacterium]|nr:type VI secretion system tube protein Hcp [Cellvibrionaceae bacterium]
MSIFMLYDGIKGECSDENHKEYQDIHSISWGVNRKITSSTGTYGDRESTNATIGNILIKKHMDKATPKNFIEACCGTGKKVIIRLTKTGTDSGADIFMEYILSNALISYYQVEAESQGNERPVEKMEISFTDVEVKYTPYDEDGRTSAKHAAAFDTATNTKR